MSNDTKIMRDAAERGVRYRESLGDRDVAPSPAAIAAVSGFDEALSQQIQEALGVSISLPPTLDEFLRVEPQ